MTIKVTLEFACVEDMLAHFSTPVATVDIETLAGKRKPGRPRKLNAQPEVASNTGSSASVSPQDAPSTEGGTVGPEEGEVTSPEGEQADAAPSPSSEPHVFTVDDVRQHLASVNEKKGLEAARELLGQFSANRISDLKADQYGAFIVACETAVA